MSKFKHFLGTQDCEFMLNLGGIRALQEKLKLGLAEISARLLGNKWAVDDVLEVIRFGLIGGGLSPKEADELVKTLPDLHPWKELASIATSIILVSLLGVENDPVGKLVRETEGLETALSASLKSTAQEQQ